MTSDELTLHESLRRAGLRVTASRLAVLMAVLGEGQHRDVEAIAGAARKRLGYLVEPAKIVSWDHSKLMQPPDAHP